MVKIENDKVVNPEPNCLKSTGPCVQRELPGYVLDDGENLNSGHFHEIIDRSHIICSMIDDFLIEHPGMTIEMNKKCEFAQQLLCEVSSLACAEEDKIFNT